MRSANEIDHAIQQLEDTRSEAVMNADSEAVEAITGIIQALKWVKGDNGRFGDMIRDLTRISRE